LRSSSDYRATLVCCGLSRSAAFTPSSPPPVSVSCSGNRHSRLVIALMVDQPPFSRASWPPRRSTNVVTHDGFVQIRAEVDRPEDRRAQPAAHRARGAPAPAVVAASAVALPSPDLVQLMLEPRPRRLPFQLKFQSKAPRVAAARGLGPAARAGDLRQRRERPSPHEGD